MTDVTKANFQTTRPVVEALIQKCTFISQLPEDACTASFVAIAYGTVCMVAVTVEWQDVCSFCFFCRYRCRVFRAVCQQGQEHQVRTLAVGVSLSALH